MHVTAVLAVMLGSATAFADRTVAVAPLSVLGAEDKSAATKKMLADIEHAIAGLPGNKVVAAAQVAQAIDRAKKPQLKACEGDAACLAELGKLVGADVVVTGEVGGLGDSRVIYLGATDVASAKLPNRKRDWVVASMKGRIPKIGSCGSTLRLFLR